MPTPTTAVPVSGSLPRFIDRGGEQVFRPPFLQEGTRMRGFVLRADGDRLAALCDRYVTGPSGGAVRCRPLSDLVVLTFAEIARMSSLDERDRRIGAMTETDVALWVPTRIEHEGRTSIAWFIPYIFVDQGCAVATGREAYGFPKSLGTFHLPAGDDERSTFSVDTLLVDHFGRYGAEARAAQGRLLDVVPVDGEPPGLVAALSTAAELFQGRSGASGPSGFDQGRGLEVLAASEIPVLFLRQLRDVNDPDRAAFQEIVLAPARTVSVRGAARLPGAWNLHTRAADSHPIAAELGLRPDGHPVELAFRLDFDFVMDKGRTLHRSTSDAAVHKKRRIAVLGGGLGSVSAVWGITSQPGWQERYDITLYQMGWRLGGKGASGRNADAADRIEEHGLHVWFGFYDNAFREMRRCYAEWAQPPGAPLATWQDAFKPHSHVVLQEEVAGRWEPWTLYFPHNPEVPGDDAAETTPADWVRRLGGWAERLVEAAIRAAREDAGTVAQWAMGGGEGGAAAAGAAAATLVEQAGFAAAVTLLRSLQKLAVAASDDPALSASLSYRAVVQLRRRLLAALERRVERQTDLRRVWIGLDFALTNLLGIARDRVLERGFESINHLDYIEWLRRHGASEMTARSASVRAGYDLVFGYEEGDPSRPNVAAGTGLYGILRMLFDYKGAVMWKMQAGMGDVVFTPFYEVLRARGVKFEFFHKVRDLGLSPDGERVERVTLGRQATMKRDAAGGREYRPLVDVNGMRCWPDRPLHDQLEEGEALRAGGVDLESSWADWRDVATVELQRGRDFDDVILGIPPAALKHCARELVARKPEWRAMVDGVKTVCTHAFQLWTRPDLDGLGYVSGAPAGVAKSEGPVMGAYLEPTDTWADMTHLLPAERWPASHRPGHIAYFCGPLSEPAAYPPASDHGFPAREKERVFRRIHEFLDHEVAALWPRAVDATGRFDYGLLVDLADTPGPARMRSQLCKANVEPSDRYTLSLKGSDRLRLRADGSGCDNLWLAGDWVDNGFNAGCVEATVMSGLQCARAVTGANLLISGEPERLKPSGQRRFTRASLDAGGRVAELTRGGVLGVIARSLLGAVRQPAPAALHLTRPPGAQPSRSRDHGSQP